MTLIFAKLERTRSSRGGQYVVIFQKVPKNSIFDQLLTSIPTPPPAPTYPHPQRTPPPPTYAPSHPPPPNVSTLPPQRTPPPLRTPTQPTTYPSHVPPSPHVPPSCTPIPHPPHVLPSPIAPSTTYPLPPLSLVRGHLNLTVVRVSVGELVWDL